MLGGESRKPTKDLRNITGQNNSKASLDTEDSYGSKADFGLD
jgi:hypothetical protein